MKEITVLAPATVSNVVCGFDCLGFALNEPCDEMTVSLIDEKTIRINHLDKYDLPTESEKNVAGMALLGAIFLDGGLARVRSFVRRSLKPELTALASSGMPHDPKSRLQEVIQSRWQTTPSYRLLKTEGPDHARRFTVQVLVSGKPLGVGEGRSKQMAEKEAAKQALKEIERPQEIA